MEALTVCEGKVTPATQLFELWSMRLAVMPQGSAVAKMLHDLIDGFRRFMADQKLFALAQQLLDSDPIQQHKTAALMLLQIKLGCDISNDTADVLRQGQTFLTTATDSQAMVQLAKELRRCGVLADDAFKQTVICTSSTCVLDRQVCRHIMHTDMGARCGTQAVTQRVQRLVISCLTRTRQTNTG